MGEMDRMDTNVALDSFGDRLIRPEFPRDKVNVLVNALRVALVDQIVRHTLLPISETDWSKTPFDVLIASRMGETPNIQDVYLQIFPEDDKSESFYKTFDRLSAPNVHVFTFGDRSTIETLEQARQRIEDEWGACITLPLHFMAQTIPESAPVEIPVLVAA